MKKVVPGNIIGSAAAKGAGLSVLTVLAIAFFAFPSVAFGLVGTGWGPGMDVDSSRSLNSTASPAVTVTLFAAYKIQNDQVSPSDTGKFWPDAATSFHNASPIGVTITPNAKASQISAGAIVQVDVPNVAPPKGTSNDPLTPHRNALCIGKDLLTGKNQVLVVVNGLLVKAFLADGSSTSTSSTSTSNLN